ncbi:MAG TPA: hypothetical protein VFO67_19965 [Gemmatimonadales bacterium]|nr:hypothetical protein [Gemmatimonadales bacterium]
MLLICIVGFGLLAVILLISGLAAWRRKARVGSLLRVCAAAFALTIALLCGTISIGIGGYRALTQEEVAATIETEPIGPQRFRATVLLPDSSLHMYDLAGDEIYVDAHILKWRPLANLLGLHTAYELDRIAGRYHSVADEQTRERTVYSLSQAKPFNTFDLARRYWVLRPFVDAQYGSATFINATGADRPADARSITYEVRVSTTGLLVRAAHPR